MFRKGEKETVLSDTRQAGSQPIEADVFFSDINAITESGLLIHYGTSGNRGADLALGPKVVIVLVGRDKIFPEIDAAMDHIRKTALPVGSGAQSNTWTLTDRCDPPGRIKVVLIENSQT